MTIAITDDHLQLGATARSFLEAHKARAANRDLLEAGTEPLPAFWDELVQLGWLGLHLPEEHGGSGYGLTELVVVVEELGRAVAPGPFVPTVVASATVARCGSDEQRARLLPGLAGGSVVAGVGLAGDVRLDGDGTGTGGTGAGGGTASGDAGTVLGAGLAGLLAVPAGDDVLLVDPSATGVSVTVPANVDPSRRSGRVTLQGVAVAEGDVLRGARPAFEALARTILSAEATGGARLCTDSATEYAKQREQFGRPIAMFQAVKHHCANMLVAAELATAATWDAARAAGGDADQFELAAAVAATLAVPAFVDNAQLNIQVHGGIGFTWEHDAHLYLRRAAALAAVLDATRASLDVTGAARRGVRRAVALDLPPEAEAIRADVRAEVADLSGLDPAAQRTRMIETGYVMPHWPKPWGRAAGAVEQLVIDEELAAAGIARPQYGITGWVILTLIQHGTEDQIARWVRPTLEGDMVWCQLFSEPDAGSDAAGVKTRATRVEGGWVLNGQKVWTSGAQHAQRGLATVRTDPDAPKHAGITTVVIDMAAEGVEVRPLRQITGGSDFNEVFFSDVFVPDDDVVGDADAGWTVARATLGNERVSIGGGAGGGGGGGGMGRMLLGLFEAHADRLPGAAARLGRHLSEEQTLRLLELRRATRAVAGGEPGPEGNVTKLVLAEHGHESAALAAALAGPETAFLDGEGAMAGMLVLGNRAMSIAGGTSEITRNQIGERILGLPRDPLIR
jgi:alkylation response protein AidB-like acyl-CoA dehydrogenase